YVVSIIVTVIIGYRSTGDAAMRRKVRWFIFGVAISAIGYVVLWMVPTVLVGHPLIGVNALGVFGLPVPITLAVAILRYQLFDIDVIIRRALIYGFLTGSLAAVYFGSIVLLQQFFRVLVGQQADFAIVASTLAIAGIFTPLHRWTQTFVDRRFFRTKFDAAKVLGAFGTTLRDEVDLNRMTAALLTAVEESMQPASVSLWLREPSTRRPAGPNS